MSNARLYSLSIIQVRAKPSMLLIALKFYSKKGKALTKEH